ncbi:MAG: hypothetical protein IKY78_03095 [Clostridia bacterium]|nr:hypothetical protein [Clostridia bacterium]
MLVTKKEVKQTSKKLLSVLLAFVMVVSTVSVCFGSIVFTAPTASAAGGTATDAQWNALAAALANDTVKGATFSGATNDYTVSDPDGKIIAAVEAYWSVFETLANKSPASGDPTKNTNVTGSTEGNRTINQVNDSIKAEMSSRMGADYTNYNVATFLTKLMSGASVSSGTGTEQGGEDTSDDSKAPGTNLSAVADIKLTVMMESAITGYTNVEDLPAKVVTSKSFTVKHGNDKFDYAYSTRSETTSGCNPTTTTYHKETYKYFYYISGTSSANGAEIDTQIIKDAGATLADYEAYFSMNMDALYATETATLTTVSNAVSTAKSNVVTNFGGGVFTHFFSAYAVDTLVNDIATAKEIQVIAPKLLKAYEDMEKGYADIITDRAALVTLATTMQVAIDAYNAASAAARAYCTTKGFIVADVTTFRNAVLREIELIDLRALIAEINTGVVPYITYNEAGIDEGTVTTAMIGAALTKIAGWQSQLAAFKDADIAEIGGAEFKAGLSKLNENLNYLKTVAGYNDDFAAEYSKFAAEIFSVTDNGGDEATLLEALNKYDSWYTGLKALTAEMETVLGAELAQDLFDGLNDVMVQRMDDAYVALNAYLEAEIDYAYDLFEAYTSTYGEKVTMVSVSEYRFMQASIGLINVDVYNFLNGTANFNLSADAVAKYTAMQKKFPQYQEFLDSHGFATYEKSTMDDLQRPDTENDIARENEGGIYKTSDADIEKIIGLVDALLKNDTIKSLLGDLINKDEDGNPTGEAFELGALVENLLNESVFSDSLINTIIQFVYPIVCKEFAKVWAGLPSTFTVLGVETGQSLAPTADVKDCPLYLNDVETSIAAVGVFLSPATLAKNLNNDYGKNSGEYKQFSDAINVLSSATTKAVYNKNGEGDDDDTFTNPWEDPNLFKNVYDEETGEQIFNDDGTPKQVYKINWGIDEAEDKRAAFLDAACAALSGLEPLLLAILTNHTQANANESDDPPRGHKIGTGKGTAKVSALGFIPLDLNLNIDPITLVLKFEGNDGWDNALAPIFEALGLKNIPHGEELTTIRKILDDGLLTMIDQLIDRLNTDPVTFLLEALPNLAYALEGGLVKPLLNMLKTEINYYADAQYTASLGSSQLAGSTLKYAMGSFPDNSKDSNGVPTKWDGIKINIGEMINLDDLGLDISSFQAIWDMIAGGIELLDGIAPPNAGKLATMGKLVEKDTNRSAKTYTGGTAGKAYHIEANKADVLLFLLDYVLGSGLLQKFELPTEGFVADLLASLTENSDIILAAVVELLNQKEYDTLREYEWFNGLINNESVVGNSANEIYLNPENDWTEEKANYLYENLDAIVAAVLTMANVDFDEEAEGVQNDLGELLGGLIDGLLSDKTLTALAALLAKLDLNALLAPKAEEEAGEDAPETVAEGEEEEAAAALDLDVNALVAEFLGIDLAAIAAEYADIAAALEADPEYVYDFGVDAGTTTFAAALVEMLEPLSAVLDFILSGENLVITIEGKTVELVGYDSYNNAIIPILEALGCDVVASADLETSALEATLTALLGKIEEIKAAPIKAIIDILPGVFYFITSKGLSVSVRNILQPVYVILDTIRPVFDLDLNATINDLLPEDFGMSINIDDIGLEFIFELLAKFVPDLDLSGLKDVIYDICYYANEGYTSKSTLQTNWKRGAFTEEFSAADLITVVLSFVLEWATVAENGAALDEMLGTDGLISSIGKVFDDLDISYGTPDWDYWFADEDAFNAYLESGVAVENTLHQLTYPNDWSNEAAAYIADNIDTLADLVIGLIEIDGVKYESVSALLENLVYGDFDITVSEANEEEGTEAVVINYLFSDETINALIGLLNGVLANIDDALLGAGYILDVDVVGLKNYVCTENIETIEGFFAELAYILDTYAKGLVDVLFFGDDFRLAKKSDNTDTIVINGGEGYKYGLALILEALGCDVPDAEEATVYNVLGCLAARIEAILANPVVEVIDLLPNLVYFLNANGASVAVDNILKPVYGILDKLTVFGVNLNLADLLGFDLKYLSLADILALVEDMTELDLEEAEEILVGLCYGNIEEAKYGYKMATDRKDTITIILTTALVLISDEDFAAKLEEMLGTDVITAIKTVFASAPVTYKTPEWYGLDRGDVDYDNATVGVIKKAIEYPNNWTEASAKYVADNLVSIGDLVASLIDSNYDSLGALLGDKVDIYTPETLEAIQKLLGDLIGGLDEDLAELVNVGLGAADALLGADVQGLLDYDVSGVKDKDTFVAALTGMLMEVEGLLDWLLFCEDYKFFVDNDKNDIITINGGHGYAEGLALVLEALGVENLPDVYAMEEINTAEVVKAILTATFDRLDAILANPVEEVFNLLPNVLYFINANGLTVAVENLIGAINALVYKLEGLGVELDIAALVNFSDIIGVETELALNNISMEAIIALVAELAGLNLDHVANVLVDFALGRAQAYESVSKVVAYKMYYHDDFAKYDMITVIATVAIITLTDEVNAEVVKGFLGEDIYDLVLNLINMGEVEVQDFDWQFVERANTGEVFSALASSELYERGKYGPLYTEEMAQYIADNFGGFVNNIIYLLGISIDGKNVDNLKDLINGLLGGSLYTSDNVIAIRDALAGVLAGVAELKVNDVVVGGYIAEILKAAEIADINAVATVEVPEFSNDRAQFVASLCDVLEPLYGVLKYVLANEDLTFFVNAEKTDAITLKSAEGYAYGIIPLLETLDCENILAPEAYYAAVEADGDVLLTSILNPLLDRVDEILADDPAQEILDMLPNLIYFINSNGIDTVVKNTLAAVFALLEAIKPIAEIDLYALIGVDLAEIDFEWLFDKALDLIAEATDYEFETLDASAILELTTGTLESYTSLNGKTAYKMVYSDNGLTAGSKAEMVTVVMRLLITFIMHENNQEMLIGVLNDVFNMTDDAEKYVRGLIGLYATVAVDTRLGMDQALATTYYMFYGADLGVDNAFDGYKDINAEWLKILYALGYEGPEDMSESAKIIGEILGLDIFEGIFDDQTGELAPNGLIAFFQQIASLFNQLVEWIKNLFA